MRVAPSHPRPLLLAPSLEGMNFFNPVYPDPDTPIRNRWAFDWVRWWGGGGPSALAPMRRALPFLVPRRHGAAGDLKPLCLATQGPISLLGDASDQQPFPCHRGCRLPGAWLRAQFSPGFPWSCSRSAPVFFTR